MTHPAVMDGHATAFLRVLASGSGGNCSVLLPQDRRGFWLIDAGLSPRRTRRLLADASLELSGLRGVIVTHLDSDHWNPAWSIALEGRAPVHVHSAHLAAGRNAGVLGPATRSFDGSLELDPGIRLRTLLASHDSTGSATMRFEFLTAGGVATLGYATDVGRADRHLVGHLRGVDVLAIESNYCPRLQEASGRPRFLRDRITGGSGHLSNQECAAAVRSIRPRAHVVLLHLSRQCNRPDLAEVEHHGAEYGLTIASQHQSTGWIPISGAPSTRVPEIESPLFAEVAARAAAGAA